MNQLTSVCKRARTSVCRSSMPKSIERKDSQCLRRVTKAFFFQEKPFSLHLSNAALSSQFEELSENYEVKFGIKLLEMSGFYSTKTSVHSNLCLVLLSRLVEVFLFLPIFGSHFIDITGQQQIKKHDLNTGGAASVRAVMVFNFVWLAVIFSSFRLVERNPLKYISRTQNSASAR